MHLLVLNEGTELDVRRRPDLLQSYSTAALQLLLHCGLLAMLEAAGLSDDRPLARRAGALLRELLVLASSDRLLPSHQRLSLAMRPRKVTSIWNLITAFLYLGA